MHLWVYQQARLFVGIAIATFLVGVFSLVLFSSQAFADNPPQVDLSVSASMTPSGFVAGGKGTFTMTVHNAGPDVAGATNPGIGGVAVFGNFYIITTEPPPFELVDFTQGECWIERFVTEPLPDGNIALSYGYYFGAIPSGESRSCTSGIAFYPSTRNSFSTTWTLASSDNYTDTNPANDSIEYLFRLRHLSIPASSYVALLLLAFGLLATGFIMHKRRVN